MFVPFQKDGLNQEIFLKNEVQFNLFHRMLEGTLDIALMTDDNNMVALYTIGRPMWLWVNEKQSKEVILRTADELSNNLIDKKLCGIAGEPAISKYFAERYSSLLGIRFELSVGMESYQCPQVIGPKSVPGEMIISKGCHTEIIAEYCAGFSKDASDSKATVESQIPFAERLIDSGNLYLWTVNDIVVSMANIAHRSPRHARINSVYTPPDKRKNGYASALVSDLSSLILKAGLTPILYADVKNLDSNKVYKNIGFIESGKIFEYTFVY